MIKSLRRRICLGMQVLKKPVVDTETFKKMKNCSYLNPTVQTAVQSTGYCKEVFIRCYPAAKGPVE